MSKGYVYLCGAGCGEADLITIRGMNALKSCDAVVYDALIDEKLLEAVPENAERICVGKRAGKHSEKQESINDIIVKKALEGKCVVRLKGGDPLVFGRGGEEAVSLEENGIRYEFIPGITSAAAVPELAGIPVTHRNVSRSFHVITGHTAEDTLPDNMAEYARLNGTLVFLMGLRKLPMIAEGLIENGKVPETPAAVISNGGREGQSVIGGTLSDIAEKAKDAAAPAVIVIGETASYRLITDKKISAALVGTKHFTEKLSHKLLPYGIKTEFPCELEVNEYKENHAFDLALKSISEYTAAVFTSANAVRIFFDRLKKLRIDIRKLAHMRFAAIGSGTADILSEYGIFADMIPEKYTSAQLGKLLAESCGSEDNILIPRAEQGSSELTDPLDASGIRYNEIRIYDVCVSEKVKPCRIENDFLVFGSSSGVRDFFDGGFEVSDSTEIICIGEITAAELEKRSGRKCGVSLSQDADGIAEHIRKAI